MRKGRIFIRAAHLVCPATSVKGYQRHLNRERFWKLPAKLKRDRKVYDVEETLTEAGLVITYKIK